MSKVSGFIQCWNNHTNARKLSFLFHEGCLALDICIFHYKRHDANKLAPTKLKISD